MKKAFIFAADGSVRIYEKGEHFVSSPWSEGLRRTRFTIQVSPDGFVTWAPMEGSRTPHAADVVAALYENGLLDVGGGRLPLLRRKVAIGPDWVGGVRLNLGRREPTLAIKEPVPIRGLGSAIRKILLDAGYTCIEEYLKKNKAPHSWSFG